MTEDSLADLSITFVVGPPRGGTTLLAGLLCCRNTYPQLPECSFLTTAIRQHTAIRLYSDRIRRDAYFKDELALDQLFGSFIRGLVVNAIAPHAKQGHLVLKDPELTAFAHELTRFFENPIRTVCVIRDPRDVVTSMLKVAKQQSPEPSLREVIDLAFGYYFKAYELTQTTDPRNKVLLVRYEDIVTCHKATFQRLDAFVGYPVSREGFGEMAYSPDQSDPTFSELYGSRIKSERIGTHLMLDPNIIREIEAVFAGVLQTNGYLLRSDPLDEHGGVHSDHRHLPTPGPEKEAEL